MAEENQASSFESASASNEQAASAAGGNVKQEAQQPQSNDQKGSPESGQAQQAQAEKVGGLDLSKLPEDARTEIRAWVEKREQDQMRYISKKSQEIADVQKKAQYYDQYVSSQEYQDFKRWHQNRGTTPQYEQTAQPATPTITKFESLGYSRDEAVAMASTVKEIVSETMQQKEQQFVAQIGDLRYQQKLVKAQQDIEALAKLHPDVYQMIDSGAFKPFVEHYCVREGKPLETAYEKCKETVTFFNKQRQQEISREIKEKKAGVSITPTPTGDTDIVYVEPGDTKEQTTRRINDAAFQAALEGKKVRVRVKKS